MHSRQIDQQISLFRQQTGVQPQRCTSLDSIFGQRGIWAVKDSEWMISIRLSRCFFGGIHLVEIVARDANRIGVLWFEIVVRLLPLVQLRSQPQFLQLLLNLESRTAPWPDLIIGGIFEHIVSDYRPLTAYQFRRRRVELFLPAQNVLKQRFILLYIFVWRRHIVVPLLTYIVPIDPLKEWMSLYLFQTMWSQSFLGIGVQ